MGIGGSTAGKNKNNSSTYGELPPMKQQQQQQREQQGFVIVNQNRNMQERDGGGRFIMSEEEQIERFKEEDSKLGYQDTSRDDILSLIFQADEFLQRLLETDKHIHHWRNKPHRIESEETELLEYLGLRAHMQDELLRIGRMLSKDKNDPFLKCLHEYETRFPQLVNHLYQLNKQDREITEEDINIGVEKAMNYLEDEEDEKDEDEEDEDEDEKDGECNGGGGGFDNGGGERTVKSLPFVEINAGRQMATFQSIGIHTDNEKKDDDFSGKRLYTTNSTSTAAAATTYGINCGVNTTTNTNTNTEENNIETTNTTATGTSTGTGTAIRRVSIGITTESELTDKHKREEDRLNKAYQKRMLKCKMKERLTEADVTNLLTSHSIAMQALRKRQSNEKNRFDEKLKALYDKKKLSEKNNKQLLLNNDNNNTNKNNASFLPPIQSMNGVCEDDYEDESIENLFNNLLFNDEEDSDDFHSSDEDVISKKEKENLQKTIEDLWKDRTLLTESQFIQRLNTVHNSASHQNNNNSSSDHDDDNPPTTTELNEEKLYGEEINESLLTNEKFILSLKSNPNASEEEIKVMIDEHLQTRKVLEERRLLNDKRAREKLAMLKRKNGGGGGGNCSNDDDDHDKLEDKNKEKLLELKNLDDQLLKTIISSASAKSTLTPQQLHDLLSDYKCKQYSILRLKCLETEKFQEKLLSKLDERKRKKKETLDMVKSLEENHHLNNDNHDDDDHDHDLQNECNSLSTGDFYETVARLQADGKLSKETFSKMLSRRVKMENRRKKRRDKVNGGNNGKFDTSLISGGGGRPLSATQAARDLLKEQEAKNKNVRDIRNREADRLRNKLEMKKQRQRREKECALTNDSENE